MTETYIFSDGYQTTTMLDALIHLRRHPDLTVKAAPLEAREPQDVTERFKRILHDHPYGTGR